MGGVREWRTNGAAVAPEFAPESRARALRCLTSSAMIASMASETRGKRSPGRKAYPPTTSCFPGCTVVTQFLISGVWVKRLHPAFE